jgi:hypothetical protein
LPGRWEGAEDCGPRFASPEIAQGIFNEQLTAAVTGAPGPQRVDLTKATGTPFCRVHKFPVVDGKIDERQLTQVDHGNGTLLTIRRPALNEVCLNLTAGTPAYFRLRAYLPRGKQSPFVKSITPRDRHLQSGHTIVSYLDFRLNEARSLPTSVETLMRAGPGGKVPLRLVAFLTAVPVQSSVTTNSRKTHKVRLLEHELWNNYVPGGIPSDMMVYHWREDAEGPGGVEDFSAFVKMETRVSNWGVLAVYLTGALLFGVLGNLIAARLWQQFHPAPACNCGSSSSTNNELLLQRVEPKQLDVTKPNMSKPDAGPK